MTDTKLTQLIELQAELLLTNRTEVDRLQKVVDQLDKENTRLIHEKGTIIEKTNKEKGKLLNAIEEASNNNNNNREEPLKKTLLDIKESIEEVIETIDTPDGDWDLLLSMLTSIQKDIAKAL